MQHQVYDQITFGIPGPTGDVTPELEAAKTEAVEAADTAKADAAAAKAAAEAAKADAAEAAAAAEQASSVVAAPLMTAAEAQAGSSAAAKTVSPKVMGDEIDRRVDAAVAAGVSVAEDYALVASANAAFGGVSPHPLLRGLNPAVGAKPRVVVLGSSTAAGTGPTAGCDVVSRLAYAAGVTRVESLDSVAAGATPPADAGLSSWWNGAVGGTTSANYAPAATIAKVASAKADFVIHMVGSNDWASGVALATYKANMLNVLGEIESRLPNVVNVLVHQQPRFDQSRSLKWAQYGEQLRALAADKPDQRVFVDVSRFFPQANTWDLYPDAIHLNDAGTRWLASLLGSHLGIPTGAGLIGSRVTKVHMPKSATRPGGSKVDLIKVSAANYPRLIRVEGQLFMYHNPAGALGYDARLRFGDVELMSFRLSDGVSQWPSHSVNLTVVVPPGDAPQLSVAAANAPANVEWYLSGAAQYSHLKLIIEPY